MKCTTHRIFLAALILAAKSLNDSSPKNKHWARYTAVKGYEGFGFSLVEVNLMEKQLLNLLSWDLIVREDDLYYHLEPFLAPIRLWQARQAEKAKRAQLKEQLLDQRRHHQTVAAEQMRKFSRPDMRRAGCDTPQSYRSGISMVAPRTPSLSPPTSRSRSVASSSSADASPESINSSVSATYDEDLAVHIQRYDSDTSSVMEIQPSKAHNHGMDAYEQQPVKKMRSSSLFSRFLSNTGVTH